MKRERVVLAVVTFLSMLLTACSPLVSASGGDSIVVVDSPSVVAECGELTIKIAAIAPWLRAHSGAASKAYSYATSVKVEIRSSSYSFIIDPVTQNLSLDGTSGTSTATLPTITHIPAGSDYKVLVYIYNSAYGSDPVAFGSQSGVSIADGATASASVTCVPRQPVALVENVSMAPELSAYDEEWYCFNGFAGEVYSISMPTPAAYLCLFDASGALVADVSGHSYDLAPPANSTYYLGVASGDTAVTPTVLVSSVLNEGTANEPIELALDTDHLFKVGTVAGGDSMSYYYFETTDAGTYYFTPSSQVSYSYYIYTDPSFSAGLVVSKTYEYDELAFAGLLASTKYYLRLVNNDSPKIIRTKGKIVSPDAVSATQYEEGSAANPVGLSLGVAHAATFGGHLWNDVNYYTFTTGADFSSLKIVFDSLPAGLHINFYLDTDLSFYTNIEYGFLGGYNNPVRLNMLAPNTTYYLKMHASIDSEYRDARIAATFTLTTFTQEYIDLGVVSSASAYTEGEFPVNFHTEFWYKVILPNALGGVYQVLWDDVFCKGVHTGTCEVRAYAQNGSRYFAETTPIDHQRSIVVPVDDDVVYLVVAKGTSGTYGIKFVAP